MNPRVLLDSVLSQAELVGKLAVERLETGMVFNPIRASLRRDPYPFYQQMRERDPVHRSRAADGWMLTRYDDVLSVLSDRRFSSDERHLRRWATMRARGERAGLGDPYEAQRASMLRLDPPDHTRLRGLVSKAFTPRAVEQMRPRVEQIVDELISELPARGEFELVERFASPLPVAVIAEMLGVPSDDRERFRRWSDKAIQALGDAPLRERREALVAMEELGEFVRESAEQRRAEPRDDLLSALVAAEEAGDRLSEDELFTTCVLLLVAGNETTQSLIGNAVIALLRNPRQLELLREEPKRIPAAVEELLRYDSPVQLTSRIVREPGALRGHPLAPGQQLVLFLGAANRDPERFPEPDRLDVARDDVRHLSFSHGTHFCLGAQLARLEAGLALEGLVTRLPDLRFADPVAEDDGVVWKRNTVLRGPSRVRLRT